MKNSRKTAKSLDSFTVIKLYYANFFKWKLTCNCIENLYNTIVYINYIQKTVKKLHLYFANFHSNENFKQSEV